MRKVVILFWVLGLSVGLSLIGGCTTTPRPPVTYFGDGSYRLLQEERWDCAQKASSRAGNLAAASSQNNARVSGSSQEIVSCDMFLSCLGAKGWKWMSDGSGTSIASSVTCRTASARWIRL